MTDVDQTPSDGMSADGATRGDLVEHSRTGMGAAALQRAITDHLRYSIGRPAAALRPEHYYRALALAVRDRMQDRRVASTQTSLDLGRIPDGSAAGQQPAESADGAGGKDRAGGDGPRPRRGAGV